MTRMKRMPSVSDYECWKSAFVKNLASFSFLQRFFKYRFFSLFIVARRPSNRTTSRLIWRRAKFIPFSCRSRRKSFRSTRRPRFPFPSA